MHLGVCMFVSYAFAELGQFRVSFRDDRSEHRYDKGSRIYRYSQLFQNLENLFCDGSEDAATPLWLTKALFGNAKRLADDVDVDQMDDIDAACLSELMMAGEYLSLIGEGAAAMYRNLARRSLGGAHAEAILRTEINQPGQRYISAISYLQLLRGYVSGFGLCVRVKRRTANICSLGSSKYGDKEEECFVGAVNVMACANRVFSDDSADSSCDVRKQPGYSESIKRIQDIFNRISWTEPVVAQGFPPLEASPSSGEREASVGQRGGGAVRRWDVAVWIIQHMGVYKIGIEQCRVSPEQIGVLARLRNLRTLSLERCCLPRHGLAPVRLLAGLVELRVVYLRISIRDAEGIFALPRLKRLVTQVCAFDAHCLSGVRSPQSLRAFDLSRCTLGEGVLEVIQLFDKVQMLNLSECGLKAGSLSRISNMRRLRELWAEEGSLCKDDICEISSLQYLRRLYLISTSLKSGELQPLARLMRLQELNVSTCDLSKEEDMEMIGSLVHLQRLYMWDCNLRPGSLRFLRGLQRLEELNVSYNILNGEDVDVLASLKFLRALNAISCDLSQEDIERLSMLPRIEVLNYRE